MKKSDQEMKVALHVLILIYFAKKLNWKEINLSYINWSMYQINILWSFFTDNKNASEYDNFLDYYEFVSQPTGPYCSVIKIAMNLLEYDNYISLNKDTKELLITDEGRKLFDQTLAIDVSLTKFIEWVDIMLTLQSTYGYEKLFRFIYRDPEYNKKIQSNDSKLITQESNNQTSKFFKKFQKLYDDSLNEAGFKQVTLKKEYLMGYFRFVFDSIQRG